ncbi:class II fructose-bisphosphate aldolase [bacterium endosymbiont of Pedicinus badii]|uniref:class II fructose-bisphosphate aldolase n=1 Tax=bacterium endosymbiont of Pedicinus badii TaxID=1719126 RepID=UPI0009BAD78F|nr:class II fructose-bisphosphate aldolase [bacterium endosymbiont of Pedicinus badii]OQM34014.1 fructose-bisphosphate aldolase [bacterium endosymbiont of Pedicinus badii]
MLKISQFVKPGVVVGRDLENIFSFAKEKKFAIPAINCINTDSINAVMEASAERRSPVIIQFSYGGSSFIAGNYFYKNNKYAPIIGAISGAMHIINLSKYYKIPVIINTDHCNKKIIYWLNKILEEEKKYYSLYKKPIFSSHMLDLSKEKLKNNISISKKYLKITKKLDINLEIEIGCTGGEEDGVDNSNIKNELLYTNPKEVFYAYKELNKIGKNFTIAASFGNVHGVYKKENIKLKPKILYESQKYVSKKNFVPKNPINFVFHGGSGTEEEKIKECIEYGVVKINFDTDIQWSSWIGVLNFYKKYKDFLHSQIGNPKGKYLPNKKFYDPRSWIRNSQKCVISKLKSIFRICNSENFL